MPKHVFSFPPEVIKAVQEHVRRAIEAVEPSRFNQESQYTSALANRLQGIAYKGPGASVVFQSTSFDDRGRSSAEKRLGADFAITATISDGTTRIRKAILTQAKRGRIEDLDRTGREDLETKIRKMKQLVDAPKVMEIPERSGRRYPAMVSGNTVLAGRPYTPSGLPSYFTSRILTTLDGSTDPDVVDAVQDSSLPRIDVNGRLIP